MAAVQPEAGPLLEVPSQESEKQLRPSSARIAGLVLLLASVACALGIHGRTMEMGKETFAIRAIEEMKCSWEGDNCIETGCCRRTGLKCWEKQPKKWASCSASCGELKQFGGNWTCAELGGDKGAHNVGGQEKELGYQRLFCFMVVTPEGVVPPGVKAGYEQLLVEEIKNVKGSIFGCDGSAIYDGTPATTGEWKSIKNTDIFVNVWGLVKDGGEYAKHDWTVKVDSDAVFFPDRLRQKLQLYIKPREKTALYFHNIDFKFDFMGALEIMSREAADIFIDGLSDCLDHIGNDGGEDIFTMECLDALGVGHMDDFTLLKDKYSDPGNLNLFDIDACDDESVVAFHPYKAVNSWMGCYLVAKKTNFPYQFTSCKHRWEGEACSLSSDLDHPGGLEEPGTGIVLLE